MFFVGVVSGLMLVVVYVLVIWFMGWFMFVFVGGSKIEIEIFMLWFEIVVKMILIFVLIVVVLGGIYIGWIIVVEVGVVGLLFGILIVVV